MCSSPPKKPERLAQKNPSASPKNSRAPRPNPRALAFLLLIPEPTAQPQTPFPSRRLPPSPQQFQMVMTRRTQAALQHQKKVADGLVDAQPADPNCTTIAQDVDIYKMYGISNEAISVYEMLKDLKETLTSQTKAISVEKLEEIETSYLQLMSQMQRNSEMQQQDRDLRHANIVANRVDVAKTQAEVQGVSDSEKEAMIESAMKNTPQPDPEPTPQPDPQPDTEPDPEPTPDSESEYDPESDPRSDPESKPHSTPKRKKIDAEPFEVQKKRKCSVKSMSKKQLEDLDPEVMAAELDRRSNVSAENKKKKQEVANAFKKCAELEKENEELKAQLEDVHSDLEDVKANLALSQAHFRLMEERANEFLDTLQKNGLKQ